MAELDVQKKQGMSVWGWLIPLLVVALLLWWLFGRDDDDPNVIDDDTAAAYVAPAGPVAAGADATPITEMETILDGTDRQSLAGRQVQLASAPVQAVTGDESFWVGTSATRRLFVTLQPGQESPPDVDAGSVVTVSGVLRRVADLGALSARFDDATVTELTAGQIYLDGTRVAMAQPDAG